MAQLKLSYLESKGFKYQFLLFPMIYLLGLSLEAETCDCDLSSSTAIHFSFQQSAGVHFQAVDTDDDSSSVSTLDRQVYRRHEGRVMCMLLTRLGSTQDPILITVGEDKRLVVVGYPVSPTFGFWLVIL